MFTFPNFYYCDYRTKKADRTHTHTHTHTPVSYTHLDVYKRQVFYGKAIFRDFNIFMFTKIQLGFFSVLSRCFPSVCLYSFIRLHYCLHHHHNTVNIIIVITTIIIIITSSLSSSSYPFRSAPRYFSFCPLLLHHHYNVLVFVVSFHGIQF